MKSKKYILIFSVLIAPVLYVLSCNDRHNAPIKNALVFEPRLSAYQLFEGKPGQLKPAKGVTLYELASTLFTDYASKQRLIKLPPGKKIVLNGNGLPVFPEGTLLAKTFYYPDSQKYRSQIIETRLLLFSHQKWNVATYQWNAAQSEAFLVTGGATVPVSFRNMEGKAARIAYRIPSNNDCGSCHRAGNDLIPIGPKASNLNRMVLREGKNVGQLSYLMQVGKLKSAPTDTLAHLPSYGNELLALEERARAYLDINCAHCHGAGGIAAHTTLHLAYQTKLSATGISFNKSNILARMGEMGPFHMPKLGTTVIDSGGLALVKKYIRSLR